jgi:nucleoside permease NupC
MQFIIRHLARFMAIVMGTSPAESLNAAGNIFIGQVRFICLITGMTTKVSEQIIFEFL